MDWTKEQRKVIELRGRNILVSAAAGSGKTAVLVERILAMITDVNDHVDIDRLVVVTFTKAAAAEMRERIGKALEARMMAEPDNEWFKILIVLGGNYKETGGQPSRSRTPTANKVQNRPCLISPSEERSI